MARLGAWRPAGRNGGHAAQADRTGLPRGRGPVDRGSSGGAEGGRQGKPAGASRPVRAGGSVVARGRWLGGR
ncbi:MAG TPA: hypothetical protein EYH34_13425 [Planctomycetes bacterium]|nr:hypothetical protein [Planctomycetota bacterium]